MNKKQKGGSDSINIQGEKVNINKGLSYSDVKEIIDDLFEANFIQLKDQAAKIASERAEEITHNLLEKLKNKNENLFNKFSEPAVQDAVFTAQKGYAKSGDKDLGDLLVDIISDRIEVSDRNILQVVLDESLNIAPKLTVSHFDTLTLIFLITKSKRLDIYDYGQFKQYIKNKILPFYKNLTSDQKHFNYLELLGCGNIRMGSNSLENIFQTNYPGFFSEGFTKEKLNSEISDEAKLDDILIPCFHNPEERFQLGAIDTKFLIEKLEKKGNKKEDIDALTNLFQKSTMNESKVREKLGEIDPDVEKFIHIWENSVLKRFEISSVGIAIAHANFRRRIGESFELTQFIGD